MSFLADANLISFSNFYPPSVLTKVTIWMLLEWNKMKWSELKWDHKISKRITVNIGLNGKFCCICNLIDNGLKKCWIVLITDVPTAVTSSWMWNIVVKMCFLSLFTRFCLFLCIKYHKLSRSVEWHQIIFSEESKSCRNILMRSVYPLLCCTVLLTCDVLVQRCDTLCGAVLTLPYGC